jgi:nucleotide-binding universal stress UspA family protein
MSAQGRRPVVIAVDGSRNSLATIDLAVAEAVRHRAPLRIVHVWPGRYAGPLRSYGPLSGVEQGRRLLELAARRAEHLAPHLDIDAELAEGSASAVIVQRSALARLLVIGHRDEVPTRPSWGSTAAYLAHHSACPLLVHRGAAPDRGPVVLAASARQPATATVRWAFEEAALRHAHLTAIHVRSHSDAATHRADAAERQQAEQRLAEALAGPAQAHPEVAVERIVLQDLDIGYTVERAARRGQLLVAGIGRTGRLAELLYGSFGQALTRQAPCPVLLVSFGLPSRDSDAPPAAAISRAVPEVPMGRDA